MELIDGIQYNYRGLKLGLRTPVLLALGLLRFAVILVLSVAAAWLVLANHQQIMSLLWQRPESIWIVWLWHVASWVLSALLAGVSTILAFLLSQILFSVVMMDRMSQITERKLTGKVAAPLDLSWFGLFLFLVRQEIPRAAIPVLVSLTVMAAGWLTPFAPVTTLLSSMVAAVFLAWDNTDLVPARRLETFGSRLRLLTGHWWFHLGFGLWFLIPVLNMIFFSFAPVGATLYVVEHLDKTGPQQPVASHGGSQVSG